MATIKEYYCSREIYRLLIEKGFDGEIHTTYDEEGYTQSSITLQMAMKWLREVYGLFIEIHTFYESEELPFACRYQIISNNKDYESMEDESDECFYTYEEAVEAAITECLECYL